MKADVRIAALEAITEAIKGYGKERYEKLLKAHAILSTNNPNESYNVEPDNDTERHE